MKTHIQILLILFASFFVMTAKAQSEFDISPVVDEITGTTSPLNSSYSDVRERFRGIECSSCSADRVQEYSQTNNILSKCGLLMYFTEDILSIKIISFILSDDCDTVQYASTIYEKIAKAVSSKEGEEFQNRGGHNGIQLYVLRTNEKMIMLFYNKKRLLAINGLNESIKKNEKIMDFILFVMEENMESAEH